MNPRSLGVALWLIVLCAGPLAGGELYVAAWNVENLFDTIDDPNVEGDEEFTPQGPKKWDMKRYRNKLFRLARVIKDMNDKKGPDILGVCEIENRTVLEDLIKELPSLKRDYRIVHQDSPSKRGIDAAILYDASRLKLRSERFHKVPIGPTRDIVEAELTIDDKRLVVFMNHWPARANPEEHRLVAAKTLRARLDKLFEADECTDIVVMGDFNDYPTNDSLKKTLRAGKDPMSLAPGDLFNTTWSVMDAGKGTYVFKNKWEVIDHILVSPGLLDTKAFRWKQGSTAPVQFPYQIFTPNKEGQIPRPSRGFSGNFYHATGTADHLPIGCVLQY